MLRYWLLFRLLEHVFDKLASIIDQILKVPVPAVVLHVDSDDARSINVLVHFFHFVLFLDEPRQQHFLVLLGRWLADGPRKLRP